MKLSEIYKLAIETGMEADPRGRESAEKFLEKQKENFDSLPDSEKEYFDVEALINPYADSRVHFDMPEKDIKKIVAGIDIEGDELLLAKQLGDIDAAIAHHPRGKALAGLDGVMHMQADVLNQYGVPINVAEGLLHKRISEVGRGLSPGNHYRAVEIARMLEMPYMCAHTATDNLAYQFLKKSVEDNKPEIVGDILDILLIIPEYQKAKKMGQGPAIFSGKKENRAGKIAITEVTGGTEGAHDIYDAMATAGIGTVIAMHQSEKHREYAKKAHINVIVAGHMSSDSLGMNQFLDKLEEKKIEIVPLSGLIRVSRN